MQNEHVTIPLDAPPRVAPLPRGMKRPFWSVMIPTFNPKRKHLEATLRGLLQQDIAPDEMQIEVIDDCSPNESPREWLKDFAQRVAFSQVNRNLGLAGIWNKCIERATGQWIHILHQDDLVYPGFYKALQSGAEQHPGIGAAFCRHAYCDENEHWHKLSPLESAEAGVLEGVVQTLVSGYHIQCCSIAVKRTTYEELGGFNPALKHALDWEMWIRIASRFPIYYEPKIMAAWRNHADATTSKQMSTGENIRDIAAAMKVWRRYLQSPERETLVAQSSRFFANEALGAADAFLRRGQIKACVNQISAALACSRSWRICLDAARLVPKVLFASLPFTRRHGNA